MKATGIVRRIDDLGRVVIPKEIRRTLKIREGDPLEIFTQKDGEIIFKKYSPIGELGNFAKEYAEALAQVSGHITCIADKDQLIAVSGGSKRELLKKEISEQLERAIDDRTIVLANKNDSHYIPVLMNEGDNRYNAQLIAPIISEGDAIGAVIFLSEDGKTKMGEVEEKLAQSAAGFLGRQMEQ
ncbi:MAG: stage V sporulation protein T [Clostridiales bacterium GWE2_32_10]|nr:MAG: stage V sporulation protein T [Clostridiales bacterium GWE2_32_10]HBY20266.1 stage V sporulation protein T [Clostridiales bacterium]